VIHLRKFGVPPTHAGAFFSASEVHLLVAFIERRRLGSLNGGLALERKSPNFSSQAAYEGVGWLTRRFDQPGRLAELYGAEPTTWAALRWAAGGSCCAWRALSIQATSRS